MNDSSFNHITKDAVFDNIVANKITAGKITAYNNYNAVPPMAQFSFDANFLDPEKTRYFEGGTFGVDKAYSLTNRLDGIIKLQLNFSDIKGRDFDYLFGDQFDYDLKPMTIEMTNVNNPSINGKYFATNVYLSCEEDPVTEQRSTFFPFEYRNFTYSYRKVGYVQGVPCLHKVFLYPIRSTPEDPPVDDTPYLSSGSDSNYDDVQLNNFYNPTFTLGATSFFMVVFYTKQPQPLSRPSIDAFVKRYIDNVIYSGASVGSIETIRDNFYANYSVLRGSLDLVENFQVVDPAEPGGSGGRWDLGGLYDDISVTLAPGTGITLQISYYNKYYNVILKDGGSGYTSAGDTFTVPGAILGAASAQDPSKFDAVIKVTSVSGGAVTGVKLVSGTAPFLKSNSIPNGGYNIYDESNYYITDPPDWTDVGGNWVYTNTDFVYSEYLPYNYGNVYTETFNEYFGENSQYCCVYNDSIFSLLVTSPQMKCNRIHTGGNLIAKYLSNLYGIEYGQSVYGECHNPTQSWDISAQYVIIDLQPIAAHGELTDKDILNFEFNLYSEYSPVFASAAESNKKNNRQVKKLEQSEKRAKSAEEWNARLLASCGGDKVLFEKRRKEIMQKIANKILHRPTPPVEKHHSTSLVHHEDKFSHKPIIVPKKASKIRISAPDKKFDLMKI